MHSKKLTNGECTDMEFTDVECTDPKLPINISSDCSPDSQTMMKQSTMNHTHCTTRPTLDYSPITSQSQPSKVEPHVGSIAYKLTFTFFLCFMVKHYECILGYRLTQYALMSKCSINR